MTDSKRVMLYDYFHVCVYKWQWAITREHEVGPLFGLSKTVISAVFICCGMVD